MMPFHQSSNRWPWRFLTVILRWNGMKQSEENVVKEGCFLCAHFHTTEWHTPGPPSWCYNLDVPLFKAPLSGGLEAGWPGVLGTISGGCFPHRDADQWLDEAHTIPGGLNSKKRSGSRGFSIVWMSISGFRKQTEASSGKCLQGWEEEEFKGMWERRDGEWVGNDSFSKNSPAPTIFNISLVL